MPFKAKAVPRSTHEQRFTVLQAEISQRRTVAQEQAAAKLAAVNAEFQEKQGRVASAMAAASTAFVGTVEDNIICMLPSSHHSALTDPLQLAVAEREQKEQLWVCACR